MKPASVPGPTGSPNCGHLRQARRTVDGAVHQHRSRRPRRLGVEVVAHHHIRNALPGKGIRQTGGRPARGEQPLHRVERADGLRRGQRDRVAHTPRAAAEHLQRLVVAGAPHLGGERRAGRHQHPAAGRCCVRRASRRCRASTAGSPSNAPGGVSRPVQASEVRRGQRDQHDDADRDPLVVFGVGERAASIPAAARCPAAGCGPADAPGPAPAAAGAAARACAHCAAGCRRRRGTPEPACATGDPSPPE